MWQGSYHTTSYHVIVFVRNSILEAQIQMQIQCIIVGFDKLPLGGSWLKRTGTRKRRWDTSVDTLYIVNCIEKLLMKMKMII